MKKIFALASVSFFTSTVFAQEAVAASGSDKGLVVLGGSLAIAIAVFGGALAQGKAATAMLDGISRNPSASDKLFTPFVLGLALIESLVILSFLIALFALGKV